MSSGISTLPEKSLQPHLQISPNPEMTNSYIIHKIISEKGQYFRVCMLHMASVVFPPIFPSLKNLFQNIISSIGFTSYNLPTNAIDKTASVLWDIYFYICSGNYQNFPINENNVHKNIACNGPKNSQ